jgi:TDG/mug DNA glycosylase family protein
MAVGDPTAAIGGQRQPFAGARAWLLPNPSGLNAHHQLPDLVRRFAALRRAAELPDRRRQRRGSATGPVRSD